MAYMMMAVGVLAIVLVGRLLSGSYQTADEARQAVTGCCVLFLLGMLTLAVLALALTSVLTSGGAQ